MKPGVTIEAASGGRGAHDPDSQSKCAARRDQRDDVRMLPESEHQALKDRVVVDVGSVLWVLMVRSGWFC